MESDEEMQKERDAIIADAETYGRILSMALALYFNPDLRKRTAAFADKYLKEEDDAPSSH